MLVERQAALVLTAWGQITPPHPDDARARLDAALNEGDSVDENAELLTLLGLRGA